MPPEKLPRRRLLQSAAAASGLVGVSSAGCTDLTETGSGGGGAPGPDRDRPSYAPYVPAEGLFGDGEGEGTVGGMYVFVDFETLAEFEDLGLEDSIATPEEPVEGSRSGNIAFTAGPTVGVVVYALGMIGLIGYSFTGDLMPAFDGSTDGSGSGDAEADHETHSSVLTSFGYVFLGDYDVDALGEAAEEFEAVEEREGFTLFEGQSSEGSFSMAEGLAFAASAEAVLIPLPDTGDTTGSDEQAQRNREMVESMIDVASGEADSVAETDADVDWVLRTTGHGAFGVGTYGEGEELPDGADDGDGDGFGGGMGGNGSELFDEETVRALEEVGTLIEDATVYGSDLELESESEASGHVALAYDAAEAVPSDEEFEEVFGDVQGEFSMESDETRVYLSVTQSLEATGI